MIFEIIFTSSELLVVLSKVLIHSYSKFYRGCTVNCLQHLIIPELTLVGVTTFKYQILKYFNSFLYSVTFYKP